MNEYDIKIRDLEEKVANRNITIGVLGLAIIMILLWFSLLQPMTDTTMTYVGIVRDVDENNATIGYSTFHNVISTSSLKRYIGLKVEFEYFVKDGVVYPSTIKQL